MGEHTAQGGDHWGDIDGTGIFFPMIVDEMNQLTLTYTVDRAAAQTLLPGDAFEVVETDPGKAMLIVSIVDYLKNPWGAYDEVNLALIVSATNDPLTSGAFVYRMPVNQQFTAKAGNQVMGLPKTVENLSFDYHDGFVTVELDMGGEPTLRVSFPDEAPEESSSEAPDSAETLTFAYLDGQPVAIPLEIELGSSIIDPDEIRMDLGDSVAAEELRSLGLPALAPDMALWGKGLKGTFQRPHPLV